jgi:hypothetical protein
MAEKKRRAISPAPRQSTASDAVEHYFRALDKVQSSARATPQQSTQVDIADEIAREQKIKNDNAEQDIKLKRQTLNRLFGFLGGETIGLFALTVLQGTQWPQHFHLEEWSFKLVAGATIAQITAMLFVAVRYLFPKGRS